ncbi:MAG: 1-acyl-sn-glycerol-3-phosphate acyltransferase [Lachnospiraceae bacterium]|nr:1-acyl-sn-glycerol-3-phosphate acyltransferase [Lachnospiraceae bacterium]
MLRLICLVLFIIFAGIVATPFLIVEYFIGKKDPEKRARHTYAFATKGLVLMQKVVGIRLTVIGRENIPTDEAVMYVSNHRSFFDAVSLLPLTYPVTAFIAKSEMTNIPYLSTLMKNIGCKFLDRDNLREGMKTILETIEMVKDGRSVIIFPEGTRTDGDSLLEFKQGSFKIAERSGCPVVPVAISNTDNVFETHKPWIKSQKVVIEFGQPVFLKDLPLETRKTSGEYFQKIVAGMLAKNHDLAE